MFSNAGNITDRSGRTFKTLRVSLLNTCNFGCVYCVEDDKPNIKTEFKPLSAKKLGETILSLNKILNLKTVRLTGGEPTLYRDLIQLVEILKNGGIENIKMTSNGFLLAPVAAQLKEAGLSEVNISLDSVNPEVFYEITRRRALNKVVAAIDKSIDTGLKIKINTVILKDVNDKEILPLYNFSKWRNISIRFLEVMKMGHLHSSNFKEKFFSENNILDTIGRVYNFTEIPRKPSSTSRYWKDEDGYVFGIIANESSPFCSDCDRLRLDSFGNIFGCIGSKSGISILDIEGEKLKENLYLALKQKQQEKFIGSDQSMLKIGG
jgi:cyclic pyranopterin phosphate synthase